MGTHHKRPDAAPDCSDAREVGSDHHGAGPAWRVAGGRWVSDRRRRSGRPASGALRHVFCRLLGRDSLGAQLERALWLPIDRETRKQVGQSRRRGELGAIVIGIAQLTAPGTLNVHVGRGQAGRVAALQCAGRLSNLGVSGKVWRTRRRRADVCLNQAEPQRDPACRHCCQRRIGGARSAHPPMGC